MISTIWGITLLPFEIPFFVNTQGVKPTISAVITGHSFDRLIVVTVYVGSKT